MPAFLRRWARDERSQSCGRIRSRRFSTPCWPTAPTEAAGPQARSFRESDSQSQALAAVLDKAGEISGISQNSSNSPHRQSPVCFVQSRDVIRAFPPAGGENSRARPTAIHSVCPKPPAKESATPSSTALNSGDGQGLSAPKRESRSLESSAALWSASREGRMVDSSHSHKLNFASARDERGRLQGHPLPAEIPRVAQGPDQEYSISARSGGIPSRTGAVRRDGIAPRLRSSIPTPVRRNGRVSGENGNPRHVNLETDNVRLVIFCADREIRKANRQAHRAIVDTSRRQGLSSGRRCAAIRSTARPIQATSGCASDVKSARHHPRNRSTSHGDRPSMRSMP